ncbi:hypothetical protein A3Q56_03773 [Intoshia linei]|uniref:SP-RING-type domain-containing protein n=1 Tax=Intoshia linei TaxID=1819745 RepID=A0A177B511_9BILA|nr:hypothetical protein A3Q56_03773 [Intoshia linei]
MDNHISSTNERLMCIKENLSNEATFKNAVLELLEWCSDPRAFHPNFEQSLISCLTVVSQVALQPGFQLGLAYQLLSTCTSQRHKFTPKSANMLIYWTEELSRMYALNQEQGMSDNPHYWMNPNRTNPNQTSNAFSRGPVQDIPNSTASPWHSSRESMMAQQYANQQNGSIKTTELPYQRSQQFNTTPTPSTFPSGASQTNYNPYSRNEPPFKSYAHPPQENHLSNSPHNISNREELKQEGPLIAHIEAIKNPLTGNQFNSSHIREENLENSLNPDMKAYRSRQLALNQPMSAVPNPFQQRLFASTPGANRPDRQNLPGNLNSHRQNRQINSLTSKRPSSVYNNLPISRPGPYPDSSQLLNPDVYGPSTAKKSNDIETAYIKPNNNNQFAYTNNFMDPRPGFEGNTPLHGNNSNSFQPPEVFPGLPSNQSDSMHRMNSQSNYSMYPYPIEPRLSFPVRDGVILPPFRLEHNIAVSSHEFYLRDNVYPVLMMRADLELQLKCFHHEDRYCTTNWPASVSVSVNEHQMFITRNIDGQTTTVQGMPNEHKPLNLKQVVRPSRNLIQITVSQCCCSHNFILHLVHRPSVTSVVEGLMRKRIVSVDMSISKIKRILNFIPHEIPNISYNQKGERIVRINVECAISFRQIKIPARGQDCQHVQCYDLSTYVNLNADRTLWRCPICQKEAALESLHIDGYVNKLLSHVSSDVKYIWVNPEQNWSIVSCYKAGYVNGSSLYDQNVNPWASAANSKNINSPLQKSTPNSDKNIFDRSGAEVELLSTTTHSHLPENDMTMNLPDSIEKSKNDGINVDNNKNTFSNENSTNILHSLSVLSESVSTNQVSNIENKTKNFNGQMKMSPNKPKSTLENMLPYRQSPMSADPKKDNSPAALRLKPMSVEESSIHSILQSDGVHSMPKSVSDKSTIENDTSQQNVSTVESFTLNEKTENFVAVDFDPMDLIESGGDLDCNTDLENNFINSDNFNLIDDEMLCDMEDVNNIDFVQFMGVGNNAPRDDNKHLNVVNSNSQRVSDINENQNINPTPFTPESFDSDKKGIGKVGDK